MEQLYQHVVPAVSEKWREFGTYLGIDAHMLRAVHADQGKAEDSCIAVLSRWIDGAGKQPKTWITVMESLRLSGFMEVARELEVKIRSNTLL